MRHLLAGLFLFACCGIVFSQSHSGEEFNVDLMMTYGNMAVADSENENFSHTVFFVLPENLIGSFYVRVFDPDCGGAHDHSNGLWETNTEFEVYGGTGCVDLSVSGAEDQKFVEGSGTLLQEKLFADEPIIDGTWVTFGPFTVDQGEKLKAYTGRFFKLTVGGKTGNDGNQYAVFLSKSDHQNELVNGATMYKDVFAFNEDLQGGKYNYSVIAEPIE